MRENRFFDIKTASATSILETKSRALSGLISVTPDELVRTGIAKMKEYNISQVPVLEGGHSVGRLEEASIMGLAIDDHNVLSQPVRVFMDDSFPVISRACSMEDVRRTLSRKNAAVLVEEFDEVVGIITKSDLLEFIAQ
jgi:cystathionine beta-synthase